MFDNDYTDKMIRRSTHSERARGEIIMMTLISFCLGNAGGTLPTHVLKSREGELKTELRTENHRRQTKSLQTFHEQEIVSDNNSCNI